jgi:hypothetical protein
MAVISLPPLVDGGQHLEAPLNHLHVTLGRVLLDLDLLRLRKITAARDSDLAELVDKRLCQLVGKTSNQFIEAVVPEVLDIQEGRATRADRIALLFGEVKNTLNVVVVDVADHQEVDNERLASRKVARGSDLLDARPQMLPVNILRAAVDYHEARQALRTEMDQQAVAIAGALQVHAEDRGFGARLFRNARITPVDGQGPCEGVVPAKEGVSQIENILRITDTLA